MMEIKILENDLNRGSKDTENYRKYYPSRVLKN